MPTDRLLITLLRSLQTHTPQQDTPRLLSTASSLLATLTNPLNVTLVTAQLLTSPALWTQPDGLRLALHFTRVFQSASRAIVRAEDERANPPTQTYPPAPHTGLPRHDWAAAVLKGADERSPAWRHALLLAGLLSGFEAHDAAGLPAGLRSKLERGLVRATNAALDEAGVADAVGAHCVTLALTVAFELLAERERARLDHDRLLPVLLGSAFFSAEGFGAGYFLAPVDADVVVIDGAKLAWPATARSFAAVRDMLARPLVAAMGPLARLVAYTLERVSGDWLVETALEDIATFTGTLDAQWRRTKLSEVDAAEEAVFYDEPTLTTTLPALWRLLRAAMFAVTIVLRGVMARVVSGAAPGRAPRMAATALHALRHLFFATARLGGAGFAQYAFVHLAAIDVLSADPGATLAFVEEARPHADSAPLPSTAHSAPVPSHPHDRARALFFLNTAEHLTLALPPAANEDVLLAAAAPYLAITRSHPALAELFEAAHAVTLAVLSAPRATDLAARHLPFYLGALLDVFPGGVSPRQFRLAARTLARVVSPPAPLAATHPQLAETLLELLRHHALEPPPREEAHPPRDGADAPLPPQTTLVLALIDCLPAVAAPLLRDWLPLTTSLIAGLPDARERARCADRFWECVSGGEMDAERAAICVAWWGTTGGKDALGDGGGGQFEMSGGRSRM